MGFNNQILAASASGGGAAFIQDTVTLNEAAFSNLTYLRGQYQTTTVTEAYFEIDPNGGDGPVYTGVVPNGVPSMQYNVDYTKFYALDYIDGNIAVMDVASGVRDSYLPITGMTGGMLAQHIAFNPITNQLWVYAKGGGVAHFYTVVPETGVATFLGVADFTLMTYASGMGFLLDGRLVKSEAVGDGTSRVIQIVPYYSGTPGARVLEFFIGETLIWRRDASYNNMFEATARNTFLAGAITTGEEVNEIDFSGNSLRGVTASNTAIIGSLAYKNPFATRELFVGALVTRILELDSSGAVVGTQYFTSKGLDVTARLKAEYVSPINSDLSLLLARVEAEHLSGAMAFGSITNAYTNLITVTSSPNGGGKALRVTNTLDKDVFVSFNNAGYVSTDQIFVASGQTVQIDYSNQGRVTSGNLQAKYIGAIAPVAGTLYATLVR